MATPTLHLFDRFESRLGILLAVGPVRHTEELGGEDTIEFDCLMAPEKGDRLVWFDPEDAVWREHEVVRTDEPLGGVAHVYAESSVCELLRDFIEEAQLVSRTAAQAMAVALAPTRWRLGAVDVGDAKRGCLLYHTNALAGIRRVEEVWGGELQCSVSVDGARVTGRTVSLLARRGRWRGARFTYGKNMASCTRTVLEDEVFTALYGFGKGLPIVDESGAATGGFTRRLTFGSVNGGANWVGDDEVRQVWGRWDAERSKKVHAFGQVTFPNCERPEELLALTRAALAEACRPKVSYEVDGALIEGGVPVRLGDDVAVIDSSRTPEWRLTARVVRRVRLMDANARTCSVTLGTVERATWTAAADAAVRISAVEETAATASDKVAAMDEIDLGEIGF